MCLACEGIWEPLNRLLLEEGDNIFVRYNIHDADADTPF